MSRVTWNKFIETHSNSVAFFAAVSATLPKKAQFDNKSKKLPTPYTLFCDWCKLSLSGSWATVKVPGGFLICVATNEDTKKIQDEFKIVGKPKSTSAHKTTYPIGYRDSRYADLANKLGYSLKGSL